VAAVKVGTAPKEQKRTCAFFAGPSELIGMRIVWNVGIIG
jgi:hypothetical protein